MRERGGRALLTVTLEALCGGTGAEEAEGPGMEGKKQHRGRGMRGCAPQGGVWVRLSLGGGLLSCNTG